MTNFDRIKTCFENPEETVGNIEANIIIKIIVPLLEHIGWNITKEVAFTFQIPKDALPTEVKAKDNIEVDLAIGDKEGVFLIGEIKKWNDKLRDYAQLNKYKKAVNPYRSFLTNGHKWIIFGVEKDDPVFEKDFKNGQLSVSQMIEKLKQEIGPANINKHCWPYENAWERGIGKTDSLSNEKIDGNKWNLALYQNKKNICAFICGLKHMLKKHDALLKKGEQKRAIMLCMQGRKKGYEEKFIKLFEYWPEENRFYNNENDHERKLGTPSEAFKNYQRALNQCNWTISTEKDARVILEAIEMMIFALK